MSINFQDVRLLAETEVGKGERWIYVADFNIAHEGTRLKSTNRIDEEIDDLKQIANRGGITVILAHKGRFKDGDAEDLDFVVPYLSKKLRRAVKYCRENAGAEALRFSDSLSPGEVAVLGNTRKHEGEEKNDPGLAAEFATLGKFVAVGGFGKAHRAHASNVGILEYLPGYATRSQLKEMRFLAPWAGADEKTYSLAVLGGVKKEKITIGLAGLVRQYDAIIPGGIVLNTILAADGYSVGDSLMQDSGKTYEAPVRDILKGPRRAEVFVPSTVVIARRDGLEDPHEVEIEDGIPDGYMIVDYVLPDEAVRSLDRAVGQCGRIALAGTPGIHKAGFSKASETVLARMKQPGVRSLVMGGDTAAEVDLEGAISTGGGAALHFLANGTTPVLEALRANRKRRF